MPGYTTIQTYR